LATRKPITVIGGVLQQITSPDTIDPSILPASSAYFTTDIPAGTTYDVPAGTCVVCSGPVTAEGALTLEGELMIL
jgi:hypothetical protein